MLRRGCHSELPSVSSREAGLPATSAMLGLTRGLERGVPDAMLTGRCQGLNEPRRPSSAFARSVVRRASTSAGPDACDDAAQVDGTPLPMLDIKKNAIGNTGISLQWTMEVAGSMNAARLHQRSELPPDLLASSDRTKERKGATLIVSKKRPSLYALPKAVG